MTVRDKQELEELLDAFEKELYCGRDCPACKFGARADLYANVICPIYIVKNMVEMKYIHPDLFESKIG